MEHAREVYGAVEGSPCVDDYNHIYRGGNRTWLGQRWSNISVESSCKGRSSPMPEWTGVMH